MLYYRRKILLALLEAFGGKLTAKSLQKYLFLFTRKQGIKSYDFVPYKYGCFSFQANQDISTLAKYEYIEITNSSEGRYISLKKSNQTYSAALDLFDRQFLTDVKKEFEGLSQNDLIRYTYINYPYYSIKSSIAESILTKEEYTKVKKQVRNFSEPVLFTIGYEGITLETYINKLIINDVKVLCDVRKNAYSQKYGFSKVQLETACKGVGIKYIHIPNLGIESEFRQDLHSQKDYDNLFKEYDKITLKANIPSLQIIVNLLKSDKRVAITCFEKNPIQCHRSRIAKQLMAIKDKEYSLKNL